MLEDLLVLDAPALELRRNRGGEIIGLDVVDGATIKVLIDETGRRPQPPAPAYEQVIHGRPWRLLTTRPPPLSAAQPAAAQGLRLWPGRADRHDVNIALRRQLMQLQHFTEGNVPPGLLERAGRLERRADPPVPGMVRQRFSPAIPAARSRLVWAPSGAKYQAFKEAPYKDEFDEWLARIVCYAFSLPPTAFTRQVNRATAETTQETALERGAGAADGLGQAARRPRHPGPDGPCRPRIHLVDVRPTDPTDQASMLDLYVRDGIYTVNEARDILGLAPVDGGDQPLFQTVRGPVALRAALMPEPAVEA